MRYTASIIVSSCALCIAIFAFAFTHEYVHECKALFLRVCVRAFLCCVRVVNKCVQK